MSTSKNVKGSLTPNDLQCGNQYNDDMDTILQHAFELIEKGKKETELRTRHKNVVLVLGTIGAGKSTLTQWIAGGGTKLSGAKIAQGEYLIKGDDKIGKSAINTETIFPELVVDEKGVAFYDCPGFGDTRGLSYDLAKNYFIKMVADNVENIKLVFTINHTSLREGQDREGLMTLIKHITLLLKDIDIFRDSILMVATKVENMYEGTEDDTLKMVSDETIIDNIGEFLKHAKEDLKANVENPTSTENSLHATAINIIDILLSKRGDVYTKIGLFRRPRKEEPLNESTLFQKEKVHIEGMIEELQYTKSSSNCFGYGLSQKPIHDIAREINEKLWSLFNKISMQVQEYFDNLLFALSKEMKLLKAVHDDNIEGDEEKAESLFLRFKKGTLSMENLVKKLENLKDIKSIIKETCEEIAILNINISKDDLLLIEKQEKYLHFLQTLCERGLVKRPSLFKEVLTYIYNSEKEIQNLIAITVECVGDQLKNILCSLTESIQEKYLTKMKSLDIKSLLEEISKDKCFLFGKREEAKYSPTMKELIDIFFSIKINLDVQIPIKMLSALKNRFLLLEKLSSKQITAIGLLPFLITLEDFIILLQKHETWNKFLLDLYTKFSEYRVQKEKFLYNVKEIQDWGMPSKPEGININIQNLEQFLEKISSFSVAEANDIKNDQTIKIDFQELNHVLELTLMNKININCDGKIAFVKGDYISLRNIFSEESNSNVVRNNENETIPMMLESKNVKFVYIFSSHTIFIDQDIILRGRGISIFLFAPKIEVCGSRKIDLRYESEQNLSTKVGGTCCAYCIESISMENLSIFSDSNNVKDIQRKLYENEEDQNYAVSIDPSGTYLTFESSIAAETYFTNHLLLPSQRNCSRSAECRSQSPDGFVQAVIAFKCFLRENQSDCFKRYSVMHVLHCLDKNKSIINAYEAKDFAEELFELGKQCNEMQDEIDFLPSYKSLEIRISETIRNIKHSDASCQCATFLEFVLMAVSNLPSKI